MLDSYVSEAVGILSAELMFDAVNPNEDLLRSAMELDAGVLDGVADNLLAKYVFVLTQYLVTLKYRENEAAVKKAEYSRMADVLSAEALKGGKWKTNTPLKQKLLEISADNKLVRDALRSKASAEAECTLLSGMVSVFTEYVNAYKREQTRRSLPYVSNG